MSLDGVATLDLVLKVALILALALGAISLSPVRLRILIERAAFVAALLAPLTLFMHSADGGHAFPAPAALVVVDRDGLLADGAGAPWWASVWLAGCVALCANLAVAHIQLSLRFKSGALPTARQDALFRAMREKITPAVRVSLRVSPYVRTPCTAGWIRPKILLPPTLDGAALEAVLAHELCHIRNRDALWLCVGQVTAALFWFIPLVWLVGQAHRRDIETACDDAVVAVTQDAHDYARALVLAAGDAAGPARAAVVMSQSRLKERVQALLQRRGTLWAPTLGARAGLAATLTLALASITAADVVRAEDLFAPYVLPDGKGLIYVDAGAGVEVRVGTTGLCSDDAKCMFEHNLGEQLTLRARSAGGALEWSGCVVSGNGCRVEISQTPVRVAVRRR